MLLAAPIVIALARREPAQRQSQPPAFASSRRPRLDREHDVPDLDEAAVGGLRLEARRGGLPPHDQ